MKKSIVLADDDADDRELFVEAMSEIDPSASVITVEDGDKLVNALANQEHVPDLIFVDVNMPRRGGKECIMEIRQNSRFKGVPIVIYSTTLSHHDIDDAWDKGALCFMRKPDSFTLLKKNLTEIMTLDLHRAEKSRDKKILFNL
jgi:CheY-like chemotaxis protein